MFLLVTLRITSGIHEGFAQAAQCLQIAEILEEGVEAAADQLSL